MPSRRQRCRGRTLELLHAREFATIVEFSALSSGINVSFLCAKSQAHARTTAGTRNDDSTQLLDRRDEPPKMLILATRGAAFALCSVFQHQTVILRCMDR